MIDRKMVRFVSNESQKMKAACLFPNLWRGDGFMSKRKAQVIVLCEDKQQEVCARHFLIEIGFDRHKMIFRTSPKGKQAGEQFVREHYSSEVRAYRSKKNHLSVCLIAIIDADIKTVDQRLQQFDESLVSHSMQIRQADEKIVLFVPKRNIETWIYHLNGKPVDEETPYPKLQKESDCKSCVEGLLKQCHNDSLKNNAPPSLLRAIDEARRIKT